MTVVTVARVVTLVIVMTVATVVTKQRCTPTNLTYLKPTYLPTYVTVVAVGTEVTVVTKKSFFTKKLFSQENFLFY